MSDEATKVVVESELLGVKPGTYRRVEFPMPADSDADEDDRVAYLFIPSMRDEQMSELMEDIVDCLDHLDSDEPAEDTSDDDDDVRAGR